MRLRFAGLAVPALLVPSAVRAQAAPVISPREPPLALAPPPPPALVWRPEPRPRRWYGWQILIPTVISDALIAGGVVAAYRGVSTATAGGLVVAGALGHAAAGPIVHAVHWQPPQALGSAGLELTLPLAVLLATALGPPGYLNTGTPSGQAAGIGVPLAMAVGTAIDISVLAWERGPASSRMRWTAYAPTLTPLVLPPLRVGSSEAPRPVGAVLGGVL